MVQSDSPQMALKHGACALRAGSLKQEHTHTHTHTEYVILIAFPLQNWFRERSPMLRQPNTGGVECYFGELQASRVQRCQLIRRNETNIRLHISNGLVNDLTFN